MTETFTIRYEITPAAMAEAVRLHQTTLIAGFRIAMAVVVAAGIVVAAAVDPWVGETIALFGVLMLASTWMGFLDRWLYRNRGRGVVGGKCLCLVDDQGIHYENRLGSGTVAWSALTQVRANDRTIIFGRDRVMVACSPATAFASPAERDSFIAFSRQRVGATVPGTSD